MTSALAATFEYDESEPFDTELESRAVTWLDVGRHMCCLLAANDEVSCDEVAPSTCELDVYDGSFLDAGEGSC